MPQLRSLLLILSLVTLPSVLLPASGPTFWTMATAADFLRGTSEGVFVSLSGAVSAGPSLTSRLTSAPAQIWSLARSGDALWAGTGGDGRLIRLRPGQPEETVFDADETNIFAIAPDGDRVFAAGSPDGRVYVVDAQGQARPFFDPEERYIWALAFDGAGQLWVGAGNPAVVYRVDSAGVGQVVYRPPAAHVVVLLRDREGRMLAGTESPGRLYRFDASGRPFVVLEPGMTEVRAVSTDDDGALFVAAVARGDASAGAEPTSVAVTLAPPDPTPSGGSSSSSMATAAARRSVIYRIDPSGTWEDIWSTADLVYDVAAQADGSLLVATGPEGRLYKLDRRRDVLLLTGVDARQITRFAATGSNGALAAFATANPGRIVSVGEGVQSPATYTSPVRDTRSVSTWGLLRWESTAPVALSTRSGNTERPDDSWSAWSAPYEQSQGELITSPAARYVQWRAVFTNTPPASGAALTAVTLAYLPRNSRPVISSVTVHPPGIVFQRLFTSDETAVAGLDDAVADARRPPGDTNQSSPTTGRRMYRKGLQTLTWKGDDSDGDTLSYSLQYRRDNEDAWRDLRSGLTDQIYVWDTTAVADGRYVVRVRASDAPSNAGDRALSGERDSELIEIDNTPPTLTTTVEGDDGARMLAVRVRDARSPILRVEYSVGGGQWQLLHPADGLADSPDERYEIRLTGDLDASRIVIRATDLLQNVMSQPATSP